MIERINIIYLSSRRERQRGRGRKFDFKISFDSFFNKDLHDFDRISNVDVRNDLLLMILMVKRNILMVIMIIIMILAV